ncbi:MAG: flagellar filament capping protein FliD [Zoogloeaceae bacterium]|nr:flagellar filament capping protein FliD [Zoogloeaceae bacterium]
MAAPSISFLGSGSGIDLQGIITTLMQAQQVPITALQKQATSYNTKISNLGVLKSKLSGLQTAAQALKPAVLQTPLQKFAKPSVSFADTGIGSATASAEAMGGSYSLEVSHLAQAQKIQSAAMPTSGLPLGTVTLELGSVSGGSFTVGQDKDGNNRSFQIEVTADNNTPEKLARAINQANTGVSATVINSKDASGNAVSHLVLTGKEGGDQAFRLSGTGGVAGLADYDPAHPATNANFTEVSAAQDAEIKLDGIAITSHSNTVENALTGVTLNLGKVGSTTVTVTEDHASQLKAALTSFVNAYNDAASSMKSLGAYDSETKVAGVLQGNRILREAQNTLSALVFGTSYDGGTPGDLSDDLRLASLGITFKSSDGTLSIDADKLDAAIAKDPEAVANFAANIGKAFDDSIEKIVGLSGSIATSTASMKTSISELEKRQAALTLRLEAVEARYRKQFAAVDTLMANMNSTSSYLTQQLATLSKTTSS